MHRSPPAIALLLLVTILVIAAGCTQTAPSSGQAAQTPGISMNGTPAGAAGLQPPATTQELKDYVDNAASWAHQQGRPAALTAFGDVSGPFVNGDLYIYALDYSGTALALPFQPAMVGTNFSPIRDTDGKPFTDIEIALAKRGGGFILYHYPDPAANFTSTLKISYVRPVDDTYWIGAGIYTHEDRLIDRELLSFVTEAKTYAKANGREMALATFNNASGPFIRGDLYIFAYDYNGTVLAWPYRPDQVGVNRFNATDEVGTHHVQEMITRALNGGGMVDYYSINPFTNTSDLKVSYVTDVNGTWFIGAGRYLEAGPLRLSL